MKWAMLLIASFGVSSAFAAGETNWTEERRVTTPPPAVSGGVTNWQDERRVIPSKVARKVVKRKVTTRPATVDSLFANYVLANSGMIATTGTAGEVPVAWPLNQNIIRKEVPDDFVFVHDGSAPVGIPGVSGGSEGAR